MTAADSQTRRPVPDRVVFAVVAAVAFATLLFLARDMTFRFDEWDLIGNRSLSDPSSLLRPYNDQWILVPIVMFRAMFAVVGMHTYLPYLVVLLAVHVLAAAGVGRLIGRLSGRRLGLLAATIVLFLGVGNEVLGQFIGVGVVLPVAVGFWAIEELVFRGRPAVASALLLAGLASHPLGAAFLAMALLLAARQGRRALAWMAVPVVVLGAWFIAFDLPLLAARGGSFAGALTTIPLFALGGISTATGAVFGLTTAAGIVILAVLAVVAARLARRPAHVALFIAALLGIVLEYALVAVSRAEFGIASVLWSRYLYPAVPLVLLAGSAWFGDLPDRAARGQPVVTVALVALTAFAVVGNLRIYLLSRDLTMEVVHQTRAAVVIAMWAPDLHAWRQELHLPGPDEVRQLVADHGSLARDDLVQGVVPPVPEAIAEQMCRELLADASRLGACIEAVAAGVPG